MVFAGTNENGAEKHLRITQAKERPSAFNYNLRQTCSFWTRIILKWILFAKNKAFLNMIYFTSYWDSILTIADVQSNILKMQLVVNALTESGVLNFFLLRTINTTFFTFAYHVAHIYTQVLRYSYFGVPPWKISRTSSSTRSTGWEPLI